jgi:hypothetical protein
LALAILFLLVRSTGKRSREIASYLKQWRYEIEVDTLDDPLDDENVEIPFHPWTAEEVLHIIVLPVAGLGCLFLFQDEFGPFGVLPGDIIHAFKEGSGFLFSSPPTG